MLIDGLIILDEAGGPIIQSNFRTKSAVYPLLHIDAFNDAVTRARSNGGQVDPVIFVASHQGRSACCHMASGDLRILCPVSVDVDPLFVFAFLQTFTETLNDYFGELSIESLKENFDIVYQLLEEMLDDGHPLTTERNALRDIVLPPSLLNKILSVAGAAGLAKASPAPFASPIPWRRAGVRHNKNEIYFDVTEELQAIVNKSGTILSSNAWGKILTTSRLSGTPDLLLSFANPNILHDCSFHSCVRLPRWIKDKRLSFVPPDGQFTLMEYRYSGSVNDSASQVRPLPVPFHLSTSIRLHDNGGALDLTLTSRLSAQSINQITVELFLGEGATGGNCTVSSGASWGFDPKTLMLRWEISKVPQGSSHTLRGTFSSTVLHPRPAKTFKIKCNILQFSFSNIKVDQLKLTGETYTPYKGLRARSTGTIEWRW